MTKSVTIRAAWITFAGLLLAAAIGVLVGLLRPDGVTTTVTTGDLTDAPLMVAGKSRDITINYNVPDTETREAVRALQAKLDGTKQDISLTRNEIRLLAQALKDLDQRTSGIEKLPDGRTKIGSAIVSGFPSIVVDEHNRAAALVRQGKYSDAFLYSQRAIAAHEASQTDAAVKGGDLLPPARAKIYHIGAISAYNLKKWDLAREWAKAAVLAESNDDRLQVLAASLYRLGNAGEALQMCGTILSGDPNHKATLALKREIEKSPNKPTGGDVQ